MRKTFDQIGVEIVSPSFEALTSDDFHIIKETLKRIGERCGNTVFQLCHIIHKKGRYKVVHYKEMYHLDGDFSYELTDKDIRTRDNAINLMNKWGLLKLRDYRDFLENLEFQRVFVVPHKDKHLYNLEANYNIGQVK